MVNQALDSLYRSHFGSECDTIVRGGIVDEQVYRNTRPRIVFLLKEPNEPNPKQCGWSMPEELHKTIRNYSSANAPLDPGLMCTWRQAGVWAYSIIYGFDSYSALKNDRFVAKGLQAVGMINLKKTGGRSRVDEKEISRFAAQQKELWQKEIELTAPDLIICGKTYEDVKKNLGLERWKLGVVNDQLYYYSIYEVPDVKCVILDFWHPLVSSTRTAKSRDALQQHLKYLVHALKEKELL